MKIRIVFKTYKNILSQQVLFISIGNHHDVMIITRTPLRISFCGGGSDLPDFYRKHGGCVISTTINKHIYVTAQNSFDPGTVLLKYTSIEKVEEVKRISHPIFRECLRDYNLDSIELTSIADVPAGTGLGSSSAFTVGLINVLNGFKGKKQDNEFLARSACDMEIGRLREPIGKQDQYAAAYGGLNFIRFNEDDSVDIEPIKISKDDKQYIQNNLLMMYTGKIRNASDILSTQRANMLNDSSSENNLIELCKICDKLREDLESGDLDSLGVALDSGWKLKKTLSSKISSRDIDDNYRIAIENGAAGGKLLGAGGGGFLLLYADEKYHDGIKNALPNMRNVDIDFEDSGSEIIYDDHNKEII